MVIEMANSEKKMVRLDYRAYLADIEKLYDTTNEEVAKEAGIHNEKYTYAPMAYIVGSNKLFPALEEAIEKAEIGVETEVLIPSEDAAGIRNPKLIEIYPMRDFFKQEINPYPGLQVTLGNRTGTIMSVGAGRVKVDFNSPLAGHDLLYKFTVTEVLSDPTEKAKAIVEVNFGSSDGFKFAFSDVRIAITLPEITKFHQEWPVARFKVVTDMREAFGIDVIKFIEVWASAKKDAPKDKVSEEKASEEKAPEEKPAE
jgi:FKBP-type peptidyl-prolyl cis-trans isomerases 2